MNRLMTRLATAGMVALIAAVPMAALAQECSPTDLATAEQSYSTAYQLVTANQWADSIPSLKMAVEACPSHWNSMELLAQAYMRSGDYENAAGTYKSLVDGRFDGVLAAAEQRVLEPYGFALLRAQQFPESQMVLEAVLEMDPQNYAAHEYLVHRFERSNMRDDAVRHLLAMEKIQQDPAEKKKIAKRLADTYKEMGDNANATKWYGATGGASTGLFKIGVDHMKSENWEQAVSSFTQYLADRPDSAPALKNRGQCYQKLKQSAKARADYEKVLQLDDTRHDVASSLGFLYLDAEMYGKAATIAQGAITSWPKDDDKLGGMYYLMGKVLEKRDEKYEEAIAHFQQALTDSYWGGPAKDEIGRQEKLIEIREKRGG